MKNIILRYGLIYGAITAIVTILQQHGIGGIVFNILFAIPFMIFIIVMSGRKYKAHKGGYATFVELLQVLMGVFVLASFISVVIMLVHGQLLSAEAKQTIIDNSIESQLSMFERFVPDDLMTEMEDQIEAGTQNLFDVGNLLKSFVFGIFGSLIVALISAAIMKKTRPENDKMLDTQL